MASPLKGGSRGLSQPGTFEPLGLSMEDPTPPLDTRQVVGLTTSLFEGPFSSIALEPLGNSLHSGSELTVRGSLGFVLLEEKRALLVLWVDEILHHLSEGKQGNHPSRVSERWCEMDLVHRAGHEGRHGQAGAVVLAMPGVPEHLRVSIRHGADSGAGPPIPVFK